jgi:hypothetical protein
MLKTVLSNSAVYPATIEVGVAFCKSTQSDSEGWYVRIRYLESQRYLTTFHQVEVISNRPSMQVQKRIRQTFLDKQHPSINGKGIQQIWPLPKNFIKNLNK